MAGSPVLFFFYFQNRKRALRLNLKYYQSACKSTKQHQESNRNSSLQYIVYLSRQRADTVPVFFPALHPVQLNLLNSISLGLGEADFSANGTLHVICGSWNLYRMCRSCVPLGVHAYMLGRGHWCERGHCRVPSAAANNIEVAFQLVSVAWAMHKATSCSSEGNLNQPPMHGNPAIWSDSICFPMFICKLATVPLCHSLTACGLYQRLHKFVFMFYPVSVAAHQGLWELLVFQLQNVPLIKDNLHR